MATANPAPIKLEVICPECGSIFDHFPQGKGKPRSPEQHGRYFLGMQLVYKNWPDTHSEQFLNYNLLRQWIQMKSDKNFRQIEARIPLHGLNPQQAYLLAKTLLSSDDRLKVPVVDKGTLYIWSAKSIAFLKMGHLAFCALNNATDDFIKSETGLIVEDLIQDYFKMRKAMKHDLSGRERAPKHIGEDWVA